MDSDSNNRFHKHSYYGGNGTIQFFSRAHGITITSIANCEMWFLKGKTRMVNKSTCWIIDN